MATLDEALYNALNFAGGKTSGSGGQIQIVSVEDLGTVMAHDDLTFIVDTFPLEEWPGKFGFFDKDGVKAFLKDGTVPDRVEPVDAPSFDMGRELIKDVGVNEGFYPTFALSADRFRKLSLVKPQGNPVDLALCETEGHPYVAFKIGPTAKGLLSVLDREVVVEELGEDVLW